MVAMDLDRPDTAYMATHCFSRSEGSIRIGGRHWLLVAVSFSSLYAVRYDLEAFARLALRFFLRRLMPACFMAIATSCLWVRFL